MPDLGADVFITDIPNPDGPPYVPRGQKGRPNGVATLDEDGKVPESQLPPGAGGDGGSGNARVLVWDADAETYDHPEWHADTSQPREFVGPQIANPALIGEIAGPVLGDRWTPTEASS